jgi:hypothetical protein
MNTHYNHKIIRNNEHNKLGTDLEKLKLFKHKLKSNENLTSSEKTNIRSTINKIQTNKKKKASKFKNDLNEILIYNNRSTIDTIYKN